MWFGAGEMRSPFIFVAAPLAILKTDSKIANRERRESADLASFLHARGIPEQ